jgi:hypothetical protein
MGCQTSPYVFSVSFKWHVVILYAFKYCLLMHKILKKHTGTFSDIENKKVRK